MPQHKALRGDKPAAKRPRVKGRPGRHAIGVPQLTEDELLAAYPFLALNDRLSPVVVEFDEPAEHVVVEEANLDGLSTPEAIADAWGDEADRLERARLDRLARAEDRRLARERAASEASERARRAAEDEAKRVRIAREVLNAEETDGVEVEADEEYEVEADVEDEEYEVVEEVEAVEVEDEAEAEVETEVNAEQDDVDAVDDEQTVQLPSFFNVEPREAGPLPDLSVELGFEPNAFDNVESVEELAVEELNIEPGVELLPEITAEEPLPISDVVETEPATPALSFDDILIGSIDDVIEEETSAAADGLIDDEEVVEPEIVDPEILEPESAVVAEMMEDQPAGLATVQQPQEVVHIHHHHYENAQPQAPQIIIAPPPIIATEWPTDVPMPSYPTQQPAPTRRSDTPRPEYIDYRDNTNTGRPVVEEHYDHYSDADEEPKRRPRRDDTPIKFQEQEKEPLFTFFGRPLGGGKKNTDPQRGSAPRAIEAPRRTSYAARSLAAGITDAADVDPQTWFDVVVQESIDRDASDLHIRVEEDGTGYGDILSARVRIDGRMRHLQTVAGLDARVIINRFKTNASLSSDGSFVPEESTYEIEVGDELRKARVALFRTSTGGDALVLRLPPAGKLRTLDDLNFAPNNKELVHSLLHAANRMVMIAGPMGSGKTTTAHAALMEVTNPERSVWSLEDPVERDLPSVTQLELDERNGAGFDTVLPVLVRSDYDTLFLGEIRDPATAGAGVRQAKAGRQVITTIHANDNIGALYRLIELSGESPREVLDSVAGVISQRLVGRLNPDWDGEDSETRYRGRVPIHEVLRITPELIEAVMRDEPITKVQAIAAASSDSTFIADAQRLVNDRVTDVDEVNRVLGLSQPK